MLVSGPISAGLQSEKNKPIFSGSVMLDSVSNIDENRFKSIKMVTTRIDYSRDLFYKTELNVAATGIEPIIIEKFDTDGAYLGQINTGKSSSHNYPELVLSTNGDYLYIFTNNNRACRITINHADISLSTVEVSAIIDYNSLTTDGNINSNIHYWDAANDLIYYTILILTNNPTTRRFRKSRISDGVTVAEYLGTNEDFLYSRMFDFDEINKISKDRYRNSAKTIDYIRTFNWITMTVINNITAPFRSRIVYYDRGLDIYKIIALTTPKEKYYEIDLLGNTLFEIELFQSILLVYGLLTYFKSNREISLFLGVNTITQTITFSKLRIQQVNNTIPLL